MSEHLSPDQQQALDSLTSAVMNDLIAGKRPQVIVKTLTRQGLSEANARLLVDRVSQAYEAFKRSPEGRKVIAQKNLRRMLRGGAIALLGTIITIATYSMASSGGTYIICWGAILFGLIDFVIGLAGWLSAQ